MALTKVDVANIVTGVLPAANGGTGTSSFPAPGSSGNVLTSNGSAWTSATPPANNALSSTFPLKSGASLSAGRLVNINSSGEVGDYPVSNSLGSVVTNNGGYAYSNFSTDGSRAVYISFANPAGGSVTMTVRGMVVTGSGFTNGTVTVTSNINMRLSFGGYTENYSSTITPMNETQFLIIFQMFGYGFPTDESSRANRRVVAFVVTVDSSGNCTKGNENTIVNRNSPDNVSEGGMSAGGYRFLNGTYGLWAYLGTVAGQNGWYLTVSGTTVTAAQDNDFYSFVGTNSPGGTFAQLTSNNIVVNANTNNNTMVATWNGSALGTVTNQTLFAVEPSVIVSRMVSPTLLLSITSSSANVITANTFTINQTTGAATLFASRILDEQLGSVIGVTLTLSAASSTNYFVTVTNANITYCYSFEIDSSGNFLGVGLKLTTGLTDGNTSMYTGSSNTFRISNGATKTQNVIVNSYNTPQWNSVGVSQTAQNTSPATICVAGVASGFTDLTPGVNYYVDQTTYNGSVTTTTGTYPVGLAVSSTQILLGI